MSPDPDQPDAVNEEDKGRVELRDATFDEISDELFKRCRAFVLIHAGSGDAEQHDEVDPLPDIHYGGTRAELLGMLQLARRTLMEDLD
jgi:hypothetical protein